MFKKFLVLFFMVPFSSFASTLAICALDADHYSTNSRYEYVFQSSETLNVSQQHHNDNTVVLAGRSYPVSYKVTFNPGSSIEGSLSVKVDQPGDFATGSSSTNELNLSVEDSFNGGKTVYRLGCTLL